MFLFIVSARQFSLPGFTNADTDVDENALADKGVKSMVCNGRYNLMVVGRLDELPGSTSFGYSITRYSIRIRLL